MSRFLHQTLAQFFEQARELNARKQTLLYRIEGVKVDIILHEYPYLQPIDKIDGRRLLSLPNVIAMELGAVGGRDAKKDFQDIPALFYEYSLADMIGFYAQKYPKSDISQIVRSLVYFEDADQQEDPQRLQSLNWHQIKQDMIEQVQNYVRQNL